MKKISKRKNRTGEVSAQERSEAGKKTGTPVSAKRLLVPIIILAAVSFGVYGNTLFNDFVYDDNYQVLDNPWIKDMRFLPEVFSKSVWSFLPGSVTSNYYRPLMHVSYSFSYHLFGLKPMGFHLINILFNAGVTVLVFLTISMLLKEPGSHASSSPRISPPFIAALLFAVHPIHTEAVAWVAGFPEISFTFFCLLSFYFYLGSEDGLNRQYALSAASFSLAVFSKETALVLPVILVAYDIVFHISPVASGKGGKKAGHYVRRYIPFLLIGLVYLALRVHALGGLAPQRSHPDLSASQYIINVFPLFGQYIEKIFLPFDLNAFHVFHPIGSLFETRGVVSLVAIVVFLVLAGVARTKNRTAFFGIFWIVVPLLPVLYIPGVGDNTFAERYLYLPSFGFALLLALLISSLRNNAPGWAAGLTGLSLLLAGLCFAGTVYRNTIWKNDFSLFSDTVKKSPDGALPHNNLGSAYRDKGMIDKAIEQYQIAMKLDPNSPDPYNNLGVAYRDKGMLDKAMEQFQSALRLRPDYAEGRNNLGTVYWDKGMIDKAIEQYRLALSLKPDYAKAHNNLGMAYRSKGMIDKATEEYETALRMKPDLADIHNNLGVIYRDRGQLDEAAARYRAALKLKPDYADAHNNLGVVYRDKGMIDKAMAEYQTAVTLRPDYADPYNNMGVVYWSKGMPDKAIEQYQKALKLKPDYADAHNNLAIAYRDKGLTDKAVEHYKAALRLRPDSAEIHNNLGVLYAGKGMKSEAIREFRAALTLRPDLLPARQALETLSK
jgi:tetratricopeptide (TPR) repeat protein